MPGVRDAHAGVTPVASSTNRPAWLPRDPTEVGRPIDNLEEQSVAATARTIIKARSIITMDPTQPRAEAILIDQDTGLILAAGTFDAVVASAPEATLIDLADSVLLPGFVEPHSHPVVSGLATQEPAHWIAPYVGFPTWDDVTDHFTQLQATTAPGEPLMFNGLDRLLQGAPKLTAEMLDSYFPDRPVVVADNSGHLAYFNSAVIAMHGWDTNVPADPVGGSYGRTATGALNGQAYEVTAVMEAAGPILAKVANHPLHSAAKWYRLMAENGITSTSDMTYDVGFLAAYEALASLPDCPLRVSLYHVSTSTKAGEPLETSNPAKVRKQGVKLWADGSPWIGNAALSFPYLESEVVTKADIPIGPAGLKAMNYTAEELDAVVDRHAPEGWQLAFHCNGDAGLDVVLDVYERGLRKHHLLGTDHRWRIEHLGACHKEQFERAASLGVEASMGPFQFIYWGDLLDGQMFPSSIGSQWQAIGDAFDAGLEVSFHNDGSVTPPKVLLNIQSTVTRTTASGAVHGENQRVTLDQALRAVTINGARQLFVEDKYGSLEVGKIADLVELSDDPYEVEPHRIATDISVRGTWMAGRVIDLEAFAAQVEGIDPIPHGSLASEKRTSCC